MAARLTRNQKSRQALNKGSLALGETLTTVKGDERNAVVKVLAFRFRGVYLSTVKRTLLMLMLGCGMGTASTLDVLSVYQPLSLHGTDAAVEYEGKPLQARVLSRPMVLSGAMPEALVEAVGRPHRMAGVANYAVKECNLLVMYGIRVSAVLSDDELLVSFDVSQRVLPEGIDLSYDDVLRFAVEAVKLSLRDYHHAEGEPLKIRFAVEGTDEKSAGLKKHAGRMEVEGREGDGTEKSVEGRACENQEAK